MTDTSSGGGHPGDKSASDDTSRFFTDEGLRPRVFRNEQLLSISAVPDRDRIIGRDTEIRDLSYHLRPVVEEQSTDPILLVGKTGTGKSLIARHVGNTAKEVGEDLGLNIEVVYVDCAQHRTEAAVARKAGRSVDKQLGEPLNVPHTGLGTSQYYSLLWELFEEYLDAAIVILDEVDMIQTAGSQANHDDILMQFSRAEEAGKITTNLGLVAISNKLDYVENLTPRVRSSFGSNEMQFPPYDANQLREIMYAREDAFRDGVLEDAVIPKAAALAAQEHGDARKAIQILKNAGKVAQNRGEEKVREEHLDAAQERTEVDRLEEHLRSQPTHARHVLHALANLTESEQATPDKKGYRTTRVHDAYVTLCEETGKDALKIDRVRDLLSEQALLEIVESSKVALGKSQGRYASWRLLKKPSIVRRCVSKRDEKEETEAEGTTSQSTL